MGYSGYVEDFFNPTTNQLDEYCAWTLRNQLELRRIVSPKYIEFMEKKPDYSYGQGYGHALRKVCLAGVKFEEEPERFPLVTEGDRKVRINHGQICLTNEKNLQQAIKVAKEYFRVFPNQFWFSLGMEDEAGWCECDTCVKANNNVNPAINPSLVYWNFLEKVYQGIKDEFPDRYIWGFAPYGNLGAPPPGKKYSSQLVALTCHTTGNGHNIFSDQNRLYRKYCEELKKANITLGAYEYFLFQPAPQPLAIIYNPKYYAGLGYVYYEAEVLNRSEFTNIYRWVIARLLQDPTQDPDRLLEEFCHNYYGQAGSTVLAICRAQQRQYEKLPQTVLGAGSYLVMPESYCQEILRMFQRAKERVKGIYLERLKQLEISFLVMVHNSNLERKYYNYLNEPDPSKAEEVEKAVETFEKFWKENQCWLYFANGQANRIASIKNRLATKPVNTFLEEAKHITTDEVVRRSFVNRFWKGEIPDNLLDLFVLPLNWKFRFDVKNEGIKEKWFKEEFDDSRWLEVSTLTFYDNQIAWYPGVFWYRVKFYLPKEMSGKKIILHIGALDDAGDIYVNGKKAYTSTLLSSYHSWEKPFDVDITKFARPGEQNVIAIRGTNLAGAGGVWNPCIIYTAKKDSKGSDK